MYIRCDNDLGEPSPMCEASAFYGYGTKVMSPLSMISLGNHNQVCDSSESLSTFYVLAKKQCTIVKTSPRHRQDITLHPRRIDYICLSHAEG